MRVVGVGAECSVCFGVGWLCETHYPEPWLWLSRGSHSFLLRADQSDRLFEPNVADWVEMHLGNCYPDCAGPGVECHHCP